MQTSQSSALTSWQGLLFVHPRRDPGQQRSELENRGNDLFPELLFLAFFGGFLACFLTRNFLALLSFFLFLPSMLGFGQRETLAILVGFLAYYKTTMEKKIRVWRQGMGFGSPLEPFTWAFGVLLPCVARICSWDTKEVVVLIFWFELL